VTAGEALEVDTSVSGCTARMSIDFSYQYHNDIIAAVKQRAAGAQDKPSAAVQSSRGLEAFSDVAARRHWSRVDFAELPVAAAIPTE